MIDRNTGYGKVNQFERNTYKEFVQALTRLQNQGAKRFIIDVRGNGGGYMEIAVLMANEFLDETKVRSVIQKMGGKAMPHLVRMKAITATCFDLNLLKDVLKTSDREILPFS